MNVLYLVDFSNFQYKFQSVYNLYRQFAGVKVNVSCAYGWYRALKSNPFSDICICLDGIPKYSSEILPAYKGQRLKEPTDDVFISKAEIVKFIYSLGSVLNKNIMIAASPNQEADQVISSIVHIVTSNVDSNFKLVSDINHKMNKFSSDFILNKYVEGATIKEPIFDKYDVSVIGTTDSDMYQLKEFNNVYVDMSTSGKNIDYSDSTPKAVHNLPPACISAYKAFVGDVSDNVPSLKLNISLSNLLEIIKANFNSVSFLKEFVRNCNIGYNPYGKNKDVSDLENYIISTNQEKALKTNYDVTCLRFFSVPHLLEYLDYDVNEFVSKYGIRIR